VSLAQVDKVDGPGGQSTPKQERGGDKGWGKVSADRFGDVPARLSWLMDNARDEALGGRYSPKELADSITADDTIPGTISAIYIQKIANRERPDPSTSKLRLIAQFFGKTLNFFYDEKDDSADAEAERLYLADHALLNNPTLRLLLRRGAQLSPAKLQAVLDIATATVLTEGKTPLDAEDDPS
jgi:hypothetical protein